MDIQLCTHHYKVAIMRDADNVPAPTLAEFIAKGLRKLQASSCDAISYIYMAPGIESGLLTEMWRQHPSSRERQQAEQGRLTHFMGMEVTVDDLIPPGTIFMSPVKLRGYP